MSAFSEGVTAVLGRDLERLEEEIKAYPDEESLWRSAPGIEHPGGTLANHLAGSLLHHVGAVLGGSGYVRDRSAEFERRDIPRNQLLARIDRARVVVQEVLPELDETRLDEPFPETPSGSPPVATRVFLLRLASHLAYHLGQISYHRRLLAADES